MLRQNATLLVSCIRFQHPIFGVALYGGAHSSSRNSGHPNCCLASWGPKTRIFSTTVSGKCLFRAVRVSGFYSSCFFPYFVVVSIDFLKYFWVPYSYQMIVSPCACIHVCALHLFFLLPRPLLFTAALKVIPLFTG